MSQRDPLTDPRAGDVVRKFAGGERHVQKVEGGDIFYSRFSSGALRRCWISTWRDWCRGAEVVKAADLEGTNHA